MNFEQFFTQFTLNFSSTAVPETQFGIIIGVLMIVFATIALLVRNPVLAVISLIFVFCNASMMLLLFELEFLGFSLLVIYVGGLAVLFLSACMFINLRYVDLGNWVVRYLPAAFTLATVVLIEFITVITKLYYGATVTAHSSLVVTNTFNIKLIGYALFYYKFSFPIVGGTILLCAVVGAITMALHRKTVH
jgi:NADH-quinone oxidoreductase subunit J